MASFRLRRFGRQPEEILPIFASVTCVDARQRRDGARWPQQKVPSLRVRKGYLLLTRPRWNKQISEIGPGALWDETGMMLQRNSYLPPAFG